MKGGLAMEDMRTLINSCILGLKTRDKVGLLLVQTDCKT